MAKLTVIVGMAGSGKSSLCKELARRSDAKAFLDATLTNRNHRRAGYDCLGEIVGRLLGRGADCVIDESHLSEPTFLKTFRGFCDEFLPRVEQEWIFFKRDVVACINNVYADHQTIRRGEITRLRALDGQRQVYDVPPAGSFPGHEHPRPVYRREGPKFGDDQEAEAVAWLREEIARLDRS